MEKDYYRYLTDDEWNTISWFTHDAKCDEVFDIRTNMDYGDYFYDYEEERIMPFQEGLEWLSWDILYDGVRYAQDDRAEQREIIGQIFEKYCDNEKIKKYVREVNAKLRKENAN